MKPEINNCRTCRTSIEDLKKSPWTMYDKEKKTWYYQCEECRGKEIQSKIDNYKWDKWDTNFEDNAICPFCGYVHEPDFEDSAFYEDGDHDFDCVECNNTFLLSTNASFSYSTTK